MLGQLAVKRNGLSCEECQVHGAAVSVGARKGTEKRAAVLRSARQALGCTYPLLGSTIHQTFLVHAALSKAALPGLEPCLTKMKMGFESRGQGSQGECSLLRAPPPGSAVAPALPKPGAAVVSFSPRAEALGRACATFICAPRA